MNLNDANRIIEVIDQRIRKMTKSLSRVETTWAEVASVSDDHRTVAAFLYGETDSEYTSDDFRTIHGVVPAVGDSIKVAMDKERGERWVEEVHVSSDYNRIELNPNTGELLLGTGAALPDVAIYSPGTAKMQVEGDVYVGTSAQPRWLYLMGGSARIVWEDGAGGSDINLYRSGADDLTLEGNLELTGTAATGGALTLDSMVVHEVVSLDATATLEWANASFSKTDTSELTLTVSTFIVTGSMTLGNNFTIEGGVINFGLGGANAMLSSPSVGVLELIGARLDSDGEDWIAPTFQNSWANYDLGFAECAYRIDAQGYVHLRGLIKSGTVGSAAFTLPSGFRPAAGTNSTLVFATIANGAIGRVDVFPDGTVKPMAGTSNAWCSLNGISFKAEG